MKLTWKDVTISLGITLVVAFVSFYVLLPAVNIHDKVFTGWLSVMLALFAVLCFVRKGWRGQGNPFADGFHWGVAEICLVAAAGLFVLCMVWGFISSTKIFHASAYQKLLNVQEGNFTEDVEEIHFDQIPMLDEESAKKLGDRKMGELVDMVSQFEVADDYSQINYQGRPVRVTPLEYSDLIKWFNNVGEGLPAYIMIDMVTQEVTVHRLEEGMKISMSDHFGRYLPRHLRFRYPTFLFDPAIFEVDDDGHPYWVVPRVDYTIGLYGGKDIVGVVLCDAVTGDTQYYDLADVPQWIDRAFSSDLLVEQFDNWGSLKHGFWNSIFGQRDSLRATQGYNYLAMNDDIYMYTGVTSVVSDQSNVGFLLVNQRTKEAKYYSVPGADEASAQASAEGQVQNLRYTATFPLLLNIGGQPTYFVALKDDAQLVKKYAMVNVERYQIVGIGDTPEQCEKEYIRLLSEQGIQTEGSSAVQTHTAAIAEIRTAVKDGNSYYYLRLSDLPMYFIVPVQTMQEVVTYNVGDTVEVQYAPTEGSTLQTIIAIQKK